MINHPIVKKNKKGLGVFAGRFYKKGEVVCVLRGKKKTPRTLYYHEGEFRKAIMNPLQIGSSVYLDVDKPFIYLNHSCDPNAGIKRVSTLFALRDIKKGEEITFDYSTTIDESFKCRCGSKKCRGVVVDFFGLPKRLQIYYYRRGALPEFIKRKLKRELQDLF